MGDRERERRVMEYIDWSFVPYARHTRSSIPEHLKTRFNPRSDSKQKEKKLFRDENRWVKSNFHK